MRMKLMILMDKGGMRGRTSQSQSLYLLWVDANATSVVKGVGSVVLTIRQLNKIFHLSLRCPEILGHRLGLYYQDSCLRISIQVWSPELRKCIWWTMGLERGSRASSAGPAAAESSNLGSPLGTIGATWWPSQWTSRTRCREKASFSAKKRSLWMSEVPENLSQAGDRVERKPRDSEVAAL